MDGLGPQLAPLLLPAGISLGAFALAAGVWVLARRSVINPGDVVALVEALVPPIVQANTDERMAELLAKVDELERVPLQMEAIREDVEGMLGTVERKRRRTAAAESKLREKEEEKPAPPLDDYGEALEAFNRMRGAERH